MKKPALIWPWNVLAAANDKGIIGDAIFSDEFRRVPSAVFGGSGVGKTMLLQLLLLSDVYRRIRGFNDRGWIVFDIMGDLGDELITRLSLLFAVCRQELERLIVVMDPTIEGWTVGYNPLALNPDDVPERVARRLADTIVTLFSDDPDIVVRMYRILYYSFLTLILARKTMVELPQLLTDTQFRFLLLERITDEAVLRFWNSEFLSSEGNEAKKYRESTLNRIDRLIAEPAMKALFGGAKTFDVTDAMQRGCFVIVRCPMGIVGEDNAKILLGLLFSEFWQAGKKRAEMRREERRPYTFYCDEFPRYFTRDFEELVSLGRQLRCEGILSTQNIASHLKTNEMLSSVLNSCGNLMSFRVGYQEAGQIVREIMFPAIDQVKAIQRSFRPISGIPAWETHKTWRGMDEIWEQEIRKIVLLPPRYLYWRQRTEQKTRLLKTKTLPEISELADEAEIAKTRSKLLGAVRAWYGREKWSVTPQSVDDENFRGY